MQARKTQILSLFHLQALLAVMAVIGSSSIAGSATIIGNGTLAYRAAGGEQNAVTVTLSGSNVIVTESGPGVTRTSPFGCTMVAANSFDCGDVGGIFAMKALLRNLDDSLDASAVAFPVYVRGGTGNDVLIGGTGDDILSGGGGGDGLRGNLGADRLAGGGGADDLFDNLLAGVPDGDVDILNCGAGVDTESHGTGDVVFTNCP